MAGEMRAESPLVLASNGIRARRTWGWIAGICHTLCRRSAPLPANMRRLICVVMRSILVAFETEDLFCEGLNTDFYGSWTGYWSPERRRVE